MFKIVNRTFILAWVAFLLLVGTSLYYYLHHFLYSSLSTKQNACFYQLSPGTSVRSMVKDLQKQEVLSKRQALLFRWYIKLRGVQKSIKAGEYVIPFQISPYRLLDKLLKGDVVQYAITFAEGSTFEDMLKMMWEHPAIKKTILSSYSEVMTQLGEPSLFPEGIFFPDTYYFTANISDIALLKKARSTMRQRLKLFWDNRENDLFIKSSYEALILASIIEKEAAISVERRLISGVFQNRLKNKMKIQADPTVSYGLHKNLSAGLTREDLKKDSPYNTYLRQGLPPTPIAIPGSDAILAALHPSRTNALYFVAKGDGTHQFSNTLEEHNRAVEKYQRGMIK